MTNHCLSLTSGGGSPWDEVTAKKMSDTVNMNVHLCEKSLFLFVATLLNWADFVLYVI